MHDTTSYKPRRWRLRALVLPVLIIGLASGIAFALIKTKPVHEPVESKEKAWLVGVEKVARGRYAPTLTLYGKVESLWSSSLTAGVAADVTEVAVIEGDAVEKDVLLVRLDERDARLQLLQREAELKEAEARVTSELTRHQTNLDALPRERKLLELTRNEVDRTQGLASRKVGSQSQLDTARQSLERQAIALQSREQSIVEHEARLAEVEARRARAEALRDQARLELARCEVRAPFRGRITDVRVSPGKRVRVGDPLVDMYDTEAIVLRAQIPSRYLPVVRDALEKGQRLEVRGVIDDVAVTAVLRSLAGEASAASGGVEGLFAVTVSNDAVLRQGRFVRLAMQLPAQDSLLALPHEAVYGTDRIYIKDGDDRMRPVKVRRVGELRPEGKRSRVLVRAEDLEDGALVVVTQLPNAVDGLLVRVAGEG